MCSSVAIILLSAVCLAVGTPAAPSAGRRSKRSIGGTLAPNIPWQAMVYLGDNIFDGGYTGGALVSERWVLTTARNLFINKTRMKNQGIEPKVPKVYLGITKLSQANESTEVPVEKVILHPDFQNTTNWDNDLALIKLKQAVTFSNTVLPIPLPTHDMPTVGTRGVVAGWGWGALMTFSKLLRYLVVHVADQETCRMEHLKGLVVDDKTFCTSRSAEREDVCFGDSGSAFAVRDDTSGKVYAAGILSYDKSCSVQQNAVHVKLSAYMPWINKVMLKDEENVRTSVMKKLFQEA